MHSYIKMWEKIDIFLKGAPLSLSWYNIWPDDSRTNYCCHLQEVQMLREAIYPSLLCAAARAGNMDSLEKLKKSVCITLISIITQIFYPLF